MDHSYLASDYHAGMVAGLSLIVHNLEEWVKAKEPVYFYFPYAYTILMQRFVPHMCCFATQWDFFLGVGL